MAALDICAKRVIGFYAGQFGFKIIGATMISLQCTTCSLPHSSYLIRIQSCPERPTKHFASSSSSFCYFSWDRPGFNKDNHSPALSLYLLPQPALDCPSCYPARAASG